MDSSLPVLAGSVSTVIFAGSTLPMLHKAAVTKDVTSYSLGSIWLANIGNLIHSVYVFNLPAGPIWALHGFYLLSSGLMLVWCLRYARSARAQRGSAAEVASPARRPGVRPSLPVPGPAEPEPG
jgi:uncharacterized protein with PQ loop repeat